MVYGGLSKLIDLYAVRASSDSYLGDLEAGLIEAAYARTTASFQSQQTLEQFHANVARNPVLRMHPSPSQTAVWVYQAGGDVRGMVQTSLIGASQTLLFIKEDGQWKIDGFHESCD
jgi:hypothetical protein